MDETWPAPDAVLKSGSLSFTGHSTVGDFVGTTTSASGGVIGNANLANARGWVEATVSSLSTGNRLRDRDLRSTMDVAKYPAITGADYLAARLNATYDHRQTSPS